MSPKQLKSGGQTDLVCEYVSSDSQSWITWRRNGSLLNGHQNGIIDGLYGGKTTRNRLKLNVTTDDGSVITCQVEY